MCYHVNGMNNERTANAPAVEVKNLYAYFGGQEVLSNISFSVPAGKIAAVIGPNGAGKTTLLRVLLGLKPPLWNGEVNIFGAPMDWDCRHIEGHGQMCIKHAYVPQRFSFDKTFPITVNEFLGLSLPNLKQRTIDSSLKEVGMLKFKKRMLGTLSGGETQRVLVARALLGNPEIVFLDEPSWGIDIGGEQTFYQLIKNLNEKHGTTYLFVSHEINIVCKFAHQVICLNKELVCTGLPASVLDAGTLQKLFGDEIGVYEHRHHDHN